ncbi:prepilin-type N-terminal cleavage/methylation domain-containing protein [Catenovulum maritimum]|uniref:MSHA biogenesis protein MshA n=1 Tax=Catenovulum maritimum TaxID=1513271 RepID=A0A0J8GZ85_9ALTE|nr:prepilin-type N-terminal cleavage/methylation domain-containing protein [Catenovulum maritimum]KMT66028.1 hypothetical protein XM47_06155 [Catenovulum maritimum]
MKKAQGFTLIELIIVIVILGILAVTAAPKFIDIQDDAHKSVASSIQGSVYSISNMVHAKSLIAGNNTSASANVSVNGSNVAIEYGYPARQSIEGLMELPAGWTDTSSGTTYTATRTGTTNCTVVYTETTDADVPPTVVATTTGC